MITAIHKKIDLPARACLVKNQPCRSGDKQVLAGILFFMNYSEKLKNPKWQKKRLRIFERDEWTCQLCGSTDSTLHVHHKKYNRNPWDAPESELITYCEHCHYLVGQMTANCEVFKVIPCPQKDGCINFSVFIRNNLKKDSFISITHYIPQLGYKHILFIEKETVIHYFNTFKTKP